MSVAGEARGRTDDPIKAPGRVYIHKQVHFPFQEPVNMGIFAQRLTFTIPFTDRNSSNFKHLIRRLDSLQLSTQLKYAMI